MTLKGKEGGLCNRTACQAPGAVHRHLTNKAQNVFYCTACAIAINRECERFGDQLCFDPESIIKEQSKILARVGIEI